MKLQTIQSIHGQPEYVLLPMYAYRKLEKQISKVLSSASQKNIYEAFQLEDYIDHPITLMRTKANLTQKKLAQLMNVSQAYISKLENQQNLSSNTLLKVQKAIKSYRP